MDSKVLKEQSKQREEALTARQILMDHLVESTTPNLTYVGPTQISNVTPPKPETISSRSSIQLRQLMPNMAKLIPKMVIPDMKAIAGEYLILILFSKTIKLQMPSTKNHTFSKTTLFLAIVLTSTTI